MKLEEAPKRLNQKYYNKYKGKRLNIYEWTLLKRLILDEIGEFDKEFRKTLKKSKTKSRTKKNRLQ